MILSKTQAFFNRISSQINTLSKLSGKAAATLFIISTLVGSTMALVEFAFALYLQYFFSLLGMVHAPTKLTAILPSGLAISAVALLLVGFLRFICQALKTFCSRLAQQQFSNTQRALIMEKYLHNPRFSSSAEAISLFNDEVQRGSLAFMNLSYFLIALSSSIVLFFSMVTTESYAAFLSLVFCTILYFPSKAINGMATHEGKELSRHWTNVNAFFINGIRNNFYLKLYNQVDTTIFSAKEHLTQYLQSYKKTFAILSIKSTYPGFIGLILVCTVGVLRPDINGSSNAGSLLIFFYLFLRFSQEASSAIGSYAEFTMHTHSLKSILSWNRKMDTNEVLQKNITPELQEIIYLENFSIQEIGCSNVSFGYPNNTPIIKNLFINLKKGDCLAIMGPSGAGKSTFLALLLGLETPQSGSILINQRFELSQVKNTFLKKIGYVGPLPFLVNGTIKENLLYAHPSPESVSDTLVQKCLSLVFLEEHVAGLPKAMFTSMDEEGATFSSGQKQRLMFARAIIRQPDVLVLDEATANLDSELEQKIMDNLKLLLPDMIIIAVSHRESIKQISTQFIQL